MLSQLYAFNRAVMAGYEGFEVDKVQKEILRFTSTELSSFYFDITKDRLYNDARGSEGRQSAQTALYHILHYYHQSFAPILPHLAEELFEYVNSDNISQSYFTTGWKEAPVEWKDKEIEEDFTRLRQVRDAVNVELERCRQEKIIGASSEASVCISTVKNNKLSKLIQKYSENLEELFITSQVSNNDIDTNSLTLYNCKDEKFAVNVKRHSLSRCVRCWKLKAKEQEGLCQRCSPIVDYYKK